MLNVLSVAKRCREVRDDLFSRSVNGIWIFDSAEKEAERAFHTLSNAIDALVFPSIETFEMLVYTTIGEFKLLSSERKGEVYDVVKVVLNSNIDKFHNESSLHFTMEENGRNLSVGKKQIKLLNEIFEQGRLQGVRITQIFGGGVVPSKSLHSVDRAEYNKELTQDDILSTINTKLGNRRPTSSLTAATLSLRKNNLPVIRKDAYKNYVSNRANKLKNIDRRPSICQSDDLEQSTQSLLYPSSCRSVASEVYSAVEQHMATNSSSSSTTSYQGVKAHSNSSNVNASITLLGRVVQLGVFGTAAIGARAHDCALIRALGPEQCRRDQLNFSLSNYASATMECFSKFDNTLKSGLFGSAWTGAKPCDFGFLVTGPGADTADEGSCDASVFASMLADPGLSYLDSGPCVNSESSVQIGGTLKSQAKSLGARKIIPKPIRTCQLASTVFAEPVENNEDVNNHFNVSPSSSSSAAPALLSSHGRPLISSSRNRSPPPAPPAVANGYNMRGHGMSSAFVNKAALQLAATRFNKSSKLPASAATAVSKPNGKFQITPALVSSVAESGSIVIVQNSSHDIEEKKLPVLERGMLLAYHLKNRGMHTVAFPDRVVTMRPQWVSESPECDVIRELVLGANVTLMFAVPLAECTESDRQFAAEVADQVKESKPSDGVRVGFSILKSTSFMPITEGASAAMIGNDGGDENDDLFADDYCPPESDECTATAQSNTQRPASNLINSSSENNSQMSMETMPANISLISLQKCEVETPGQGQGHRKRKEIQLQQEGKAPRPARRMEATDIATTLCQQNDRKLSMSRDDKVKASSAVERHQPPAGFWIICNYAIPIKASQISSQDGAAVIDESSCFFSECGRPVRSRSKFQQFTVSSMSRHLEDIDAACCYVLPQEFWKIYSQSAQPCEWECAIKARNDTSTLQLAQLRESCRQLVNTTLADLISDYHYVGVKKHDKCDQMFVCEVAGLSSATASIVDLGGFHSEMEAAMIREQVLNSTNKMTDEGPMAANFNEAEWAALVACSLLYLKYCKHHCKSFNSP